LGFSPFSPEFPYSPLTKMKIQKEVNGQMRYFECNASAYENFYKPLGYMPVENTLLTVAAVPAQRVLDDMPPESTKEDGIELKPIGQWTEQELRDYARELGWSENSPIGILRKRIKDKLAQ